MMADCAAVAARLTAHEATGRPPGPPQGTREQLTGRSHRRLLSSYAATYSMLHGIHT